MTMPKTWKHPDLGTFKFDDGWKTTVKIPAFKAFKYETGYDKEYPSGTYELAFSADNEADTPAQPLIAVAKKILENPDHIISLVTTALWDDISGHGPDSGMWWHGDLKKVLAHSKNVGTKMTAPKSAKDLLPFLELHTIQMREEEKARPARFGVNPFTREKLKLKPSPHVPACAELQFSAPFEVEHGLSILTDATTVLGIGYHLDVEPFKTK
jgi:hypothetical protein